MNHDTMIPVYDRLYAESAYGITSKRRLRVIADWIVEHVPRGASCLDASCGRGYLLGYLTGKGYQMEGTEASGVLVENDLRHYVVHHLRYSELSDLGEKRYDVVISSDVLEHLLSEEEVRQALTDLAALSRSYLCLTASRSSGTARRWLGQPEGRVTRLHHVVKPFAWWDAEVARVCDVSFRYEHRSCLSLFGVVK